MNVLLLSKGFVPRRRRRGDDAEQYTNILLQSYQNLNGFLCAFIDHSLPNHRYFIRNRYFLEKIFNYEFQMGVQPDLTGNIDNLFFIGKFSPHTHTSSIFLASFSSKIMNEHSLESYSTEKKTLYLFGI